MANKIQVSIGAIVQSTESISKLLNAFEENFDIKEEEFSRNEIKGHFDNPIVLLNTSIEKKKAKDFIHNLISRIPEEQIKRITNEIPERTINSSFHMRIDRDELLRNKISINEKSTIKLKIQIPIYNKKETVSEFSRILSPHLE